MPRKRVMVVEDNPFDAFVISKVIKEAEIDVDIIVFDTGEDARAYLSNRDSQVPHIIILDWNLIKVHGREILKLVKDSEELRSIHVIVFTTSSNESDMQEALKMHANCFAVKPDDYNTLEEGLSKALSLWLSPVPFFKIPRPTR